MAEHAQCTIDGGVLVYFCDPSSPWQRGSNETSNGSLRQFFPKGTDFTTYDRAMQTLGGYAFSQECHVERLWRDVRLFRLAPVAQELILGFVGQHVPGMPKTC